MSMLEELLPKMKVWCWEECEVSGDWASSSSSEGSIRMALRSST